MAIFLIISRTIVTLSVNYLGQWRLDMMAGLSATDPVDRRIFHVPCFVPSHMTLSLLYTTQNFERLRNWGKWHCHDLDYLQVIGGMDHNEQNMNWLMLNNTRLTTYQIPSKSSTQFWHSVHTMSQSLLVLVIWSLGLPTTVVVQVGQNVGWWGTHCRYHHQAQTHLFPHRNSVFRRSRHNSSLLMSYCFLHRLQGPKSSSEWGWHCRLVS